MGEELTLYFNAGPLFVLALRALDESRRDTYRPGDKAIVSVVFAASALEAFMNEIVATSAALLKSGKYSNDRIKAFSQLASELEESKASVRYKFILAKWILSGVPFDKGSAPFQDFSALVDVRNELLHMKAIETVEIKNNEPVFRMPRVIEHLKTKGVLIGNPDGKSNWKDHLCTPDCAKWACNAAAAMVRSITKELPADSIWPGVKEVYDEVFIQC